MHRPFNYSRQGCTRNEDASTAYFRALIFGLSESVTIFGTGSFCIPPPIARTERNANMKLKIRYENEYQTIVLNEQDTEAMWVSLSLDGEGLSQEEKESRIQEAWNETFNKPEYNCWHMHDRHTGLPGSALRTEGDDDGYTEGEPLMSEVRDDSIFWQDEIRRRNRYEYEDWCERIRKEMSPEYAEMIIAIALDGMTVSEYAASIGESNANTVSHRYRRAVKKFKEIFPKTSF